MKWIKQMFTHPPVGEILTQQLEEAERLQAEHMAAGELHIALAAVYERRVTRIRGQQAQGAELRAVK